MSNELKVRSAALEAAAILVPEGEHDVQTLRHAARQVIAQALEDYILLGNLEHDLAGEKLEEILDTMKGGSSLNEKTRLQVRDVLEELFGVELYVPF